MQFFERLKTRWGITSNWQFLLINVAFALTGSTALWVRKHLFAYFDISLDTTHWALYALIYLFTIVPAYYILVLFYGALLGQWSFFYRFTTRGFRRMKERRERRRQQAEASQS